MAFCVTVLFPESFALTALSKALFNLLPFCFSGSLKASPLWDVSYDKTEYGSLASAARCQRYRSSRIHEATQRGACVLGQIAVC